MCGIVGSTNYNLSRLVLNGLHHRGPDSRGMYSSDKVTLGHTRLSIIDLENGSQPMVDDGVAIVFNGEIYNYRQLRSDLKNCTTDSDTEVLLQCYKKYGIEKTLENINGMFSFAIFDGDKIFLARDRLGIKPLFYHQDDNGITFSSEIEPIKDVVGVERLTIDPMSVSLFFNMYYIPSPNTIWKEIRNLNPGCFMEYNTKTKESRIKKYWQLERTNKSATDLKYLETLLKDAVSLRMRSDVPYGAYLSGGVDSSLIVKHMSLLEDGTKTFTAQIGDKELDEREYALKVAEECKTRHTNLPVEYTDIKLSFLRKISKNFGQPFADSSVVPTYLISREIAKNVTVALGGDGSDELFCGYNKYNKAENGVQGHFFRNTQNNFLTKEYKKDSFGYLLSLLPYAPKNNMEMMRLLDIRVFLEGDILQKVDRTSMANSLEVRVPFLDHRVVEYSNDLSDDILYGKIRKRAIKDILGKYFSHDFVHRPKIGFMLNTGDWVDKLFEQIKTYKVFDSGIFDKKQDLSKLSNKYLKFAILMFALWYEEVYA